MSSDQEEPSVGDELNGVRFDRCRLGASALLKRAAELLRDIGLSDLADRAADIRDEIELTTAERAGELIAEAGLSPEEDYFPVSFVVSLLPQIDQADAHAEGRD